MTSVGLVGGLGPESTIDYYRRILEAWQREEPTTAPSIVIDSADFVAITASTPHVVFDALAAPSPVTVAPVEPDHRGGSDTRHDTVARDGHRFAVAGRSRVASHTRLISITSGHRRHVQRGAPLQGCPALRM